MNATKPSFTRPRSFTRLLIAILLVTAFAMPGYHPSAAQQSIVVNGSFEQPDVTGISLRPAGEVFGNWTVESGSIEIIGGRWQAANGKQVLDMNGGSAGTIFQDLSTVAGQTYRLRFAMAGNPEGGPTLKQMEVRWGERRSCATCRPTCPIPSKGPASAASLLPSPFGKTRAP